MRKGRAVSAFLFAVACSVTALGGFAVGITTRPAATPHPTWTDYEIVEHGGATFNRCVYHLADGTTHIVELTRVSSCPSKAPGT